MDQMVKRLLLYVLACLKYLLFRSVCVCVCARARVCVGVCVDIILVLRFKNDCCHRYGQDGRQSLRETVCHQ